MDPLSLLAIFGANVVGNKLSGASTKDAIKGSILPTLTAGVGGGPASMGGNAFGQFALKQGLTSASNEFGKNALQQLLIDRAKQFAAAKVGQKVGEKIGIDPNLTGALASNFALPMADSMMSNITSADVENLGTVDVLKKKFFEDKALQAKYKNADEYVKAVSQIQSQVNTGDGKKSNAFLDLFKTDGSYDLDKISKGATLFGVPALLYASGAFKPKDRTMITPTYNKNYPELRKRRGGLKRINPITGKEEVVDMVPIPETGSRGDPYEYSERVFKAATGGIAQALPSKTTHDENDVTNYKRAGGYVIDGADNGNKNEDTMLAQLADGEFVTRTDGVLGAGILAGANPKNEDEMRDKGAKFFYEQQARFKRIYDLLNANRTATVQ